MSRLWEKLDKWLTNVEIIGTVVTTIRVVTLSHLLLFMVLLVWRLWNFLREIFLRKMRENVLGEMGRDVLREMGRNVKIKLGLNLLKEIILSGFMSDIKLSHLLLKCFAKPVIVIRQKFVFSR
jgi:hypothetical protein